MSKPLSRKHVYDSDDGFVEDGRSSKKSRREPKPRNSAMQKDDDGNEFWELSGKRRVQISQFKNNTMIGIREYYEKDGKSLPGKKGISMTVEQYTAFLELIPDIESVLNSRGIKVPRPQFDKKLDVEDDDENSEAEDEGAEEDQDDEEHAKVSKKHKVTLDRLKAKKNHEATSDEDSG